MTTKKILVISGVTLLAGGILYLVYQYKKLMEYVLNFKFIKVKEVSASKVAFDLSVEFVNNSNLKVNLRKQRYQVYVNDKFVSKGGTDKPTSLAPKQGTVLTNAVVFKPSDLLKVLQRGWAEMLLKPELVKIRVDYQINASLVGVAVPIKNSYEITLRQIMDMRNK